MSSKEKRKKAILRTAQISFKAIMIEAIIVGIIIIGGYLFLHIPIWVIELFYSTEEVGIYTINYTHIYEIEIAIIAGGILVCYYTRKLYLSNLSDIEREKKEYLKYSFINNSILLTTDTINRNGFHEVWRQKNNEHSIQILCFNEETGEFQAFDRFHWMDEPRIVINPPSWYKIDGRDVHCDSFQSDGIYYKEDLWTPIKLHCTEEWLKDILKEKRR